MLYIDTHRITQIFPAPEGTIYINKFGEPQHPQLLGMIESVLPRPEEAPQELVVIEMPGEYRVGVPTAPRYLRIGRDIVCICSQFTPTSQIEKLITEFKKRQKENEIPLEEYEAKRAKTLAEAVKSAKPKDVEIHYRNYEADNEEVVVLLRTPFPDKTDDPESYESCQGVVEYTQKVIYDGNRCDFIAILEEYKLRDFFAQVKIHGPLTITKKAAAKPRRRSR